MKKSRFLASAMPLACIEDAGTLLRSAWRDEASHNCWAWRFGESYRSSDDGEPAGTAGRPILAAIDGSGLDRVLVVVARWFGGIKLGAGGLVRAYGGCAAECLRRAPRVELIDQRQLQVAGDFSCVGALYAQLPRFDAAVLEESHDGAGVRWTLAVAADRCDALAAALRDATRGQVEIDVGD